MSEITHAGLSGTRFKNPGKKRGQKDIFYNLSCMTIKRYNFFKLELKWVTSGLFILIYLLYLKTCLSLYE